MRVPRRGVARCGRVWIVLAVVTSSARPRSRMPRTRCWCCATARRHGRRRPDRRRERVVGRESLRGGALSEVRAAPRLRPPLDVLTASGLLPESGGRRARSAAAQPRGPGRGIPRRVAEIVSYSVVRTSPQGIRFRVNESPYLAPDGIRPPARRDGAGTHPDPVRAVDPRHAHCRADRSRSDLRDRRSPSFAVHWRDGGIAADGSAGGGWYLEYAHDKGDGARVLNGFMRTFVSLDKFATQTGRRLGEDPSGVPSVTGHASMCASARSSSIRTSMRTTSGAA